MSQEWMTESHRLVSSPRFQNAKKELLSVILDSCSSVRSIRPTPENSPAREQYLKTLQEFTRDRGRDLYFPFLSSGLGSGMYVELADGSVKIDLITGIGINFFGHAHPELISEMIQALSQDTMQGNLQPGIEARELLRALLARVGPESRLKHGWLLCSGTMSNEIALKIIRQKRTPATKILAFKDCFAGRSTAMQEITDNPKYREGQPVYGEVEYLSFYDPKLGLQANLARTLGEMREHLTRYPGKFAALMMELVQGEGGFSYAPQDFYVQIFEEAKKANLAIWLDEIQTFGRTGEYFAYQTLGLSKYVDVVTVGKMLQACGVLYTEEFNPKAGLVAGTFSGSTVALRTGRRVLELLGEGGFLGKEGKIARLSARFASNLDRLAQGPCKGMMSERRNLGGMIAFQPFSGTMDDIKAVLTTLFDMGVVAFFCGHGPYLIRMLPPLGAMTEQEVDLVCEKVQTAILDVARRRASGEKSGAKA